MWRMFREEETSISSADLVALSVLLDEWCRRHGINQFDQSATAAAQSLIAKRRAGATIDSLKQSLASGLPTWFRE